MENKTVILIVDDDSSIREPIARLLEGEGFQTEQAESGDEALNLIAQRDFKLVISDVQMPGLDGIELLKQVQKLPRRIAVIIMTGFGSVDRAVEAIKLGAFDYLEKPVDTERLMIIVRNALEKMELREQVEILSDQIKGEFDFGNIIGKSMPMLETLNLVRKVARSDINVLITGESGTGKELIARAVHTNSNRSRGPFVPINCTAITDTLFEAELFGHEKGAFTGAIGRKDGYLKKANGGTLFLDEIADMPPSLQSKLLRVIQEKQFQRVGSTDPIEIDVRFVSATNRDIQQMIEKGTFREDLLYRLNVAAVELPPLRKRKEDIPVLTRHFIENYARSMGKPVEGVSDSVMRTFTSYPWPGNVRELENMIQRAIAVSEKNLITEEDLPDMIIKKVESGVRSERPYSETKFSEAKRHAVDGFERDFLTKALKRNKGNVSRTADEIGMVRTALQRLLKKHNILPADFKKR